MRRAVILISLAVGVLSTQACSTSGAGTVADDMVLKGVSTIYVEPPLQFYLQRALAKDLPQVRVVPDQNSADATLYVNEEENRPSAKTMALVRRPDGRSTVIYEGVSGISFTNEIVSDFIRAWRAANAGTANAVLGGTRSVYVDKAVGTWVLGPISNSLPEVRVASNAAEADVILKFEIADPRGTPATSASSSDAYGRPISIPTSVGTSSTGRTVVVRAVNRMNGSSLVLYDGFSVYMGAHLGPNFVSAWRKANS